MRVGAVEAHSVSRGPSEVANRTLPSSTRRPLATVAERHRLGGIWSPIGSEAEAPPPCRLRLASMAGRDVWAMPLSTPPRIQRQPVRRRLRSLERRSTSKLSEPAVGPLGSRSHIASRSGSSDGVSRSQPGMSSSAGIFHPSCTLSPTNEAEPNGNRPAASVALIERCASRAVTNASTACLAGSVGARAEHSTRVPSRTPSAVP